MEFIKNSKIDTLDFNLCKLNIALFLRALLMFSPVWFFFTLKMT